MTKLIVKLTSKIKSSYQKGQINKALINFINIQRTGINPNESTLSTTITVCSQSPHKSFGYNLHSLILKKGYSNQLFISSGLISMYAKFGFIDNARKVFDEMPQRDGFVWTTMISCYSQWKLSGEACRLFWSMINGGVDDLRSGVNDFTVVSVVNACGYLGYVWLGRCLHCYVVKVGYDLDVFVGSSLVDLYSKCNELGCARRVFDQLWNRDVVVWNTMITGYAQNGCEEEAVVLFICMEREGVSPNNTTFSVVLDASSTMHDGLLGRSFHAKTLKLGMLSDVYLGTALVDMYSKFLNIDDAGIAFSDISDKNVVSYNALITGYGLSGDHENALETYTLLRSHEMVPDTLTFIGLFSSCATSCALLEGSQVHSHAIMLSLNLDSLVRNTIVNFYSKCGLIDSAIRAFQTVKANDVVSWTTIISGLVQNNESVKALELYYEMHKLLSKTDEFSSSSVIKAAATLTAIAQGRHLHGHVIKTGLEHKMYVGSALIDMYSKCGVIKDACLLFRELPEKNVVTWNSMITGYAQNGFPNETLLLFKEMEMCGILPTSVTFVGILLACCHSEQVEKGRYYYHLMETKYGISPSIEHCSCMVNLLGRCGYVDEAETFLLGSPFKEDHGIWRSLLTFCEAHNDFDVASRVAEYCLRLRPDDSSTLTVLSNIYAAKQLWSEVGKTRDFMKMTGVAKEPGCSWIEAKD